jgi:transposase
MHHWVDRRIEAHIFICVLALQIQRVMRQRLRKVNIRRSPEMVLEKLSRQRTVETDANGRKLRGLVRATEEQLHLFKALSMPAPQHKHLTDPTL